METSMDDVLALLGAKEVQLLIANRQIAKLEAEVMQKEQELIDLGAREKTDTSTNDTEDTDKE
jgi:hypothetical protein